VPIPELLAIHGQETSSGMEQILGLSAMRERYRERFAGDKWWTHQDLNLGPKDYETEVIQKTPVPISPSLSASNIESTPSVVVPLVLPSELIERHFTIMYGDIGFSYESIMGPYLQGAKAVVIEDPYIRLQHQIQNFVRFCETVLRATTIKRICLITGYDDKTQLAEIAEKMEELKQSLLDLDVELEVKLNPNIHDREIRIDNGWTIKIGRGLDFYQKPGGWFEVGANDMSLRKCLETKVDIFRT
jgi:ATP-dependent Lon protease